ncbi:hypothetical protein EON81_03695 [bacterium]|nr:MAG: hypothetical protein EON81_03695 [bacterium]
MRRTLCACAALFVLLSCGPKAAEPTAVTKSEPPEERLYTALRAGTYQTNAALEAIREASDHAKPLSEAAEGEAKEALLDLLDLLDSSGRLLADHVEEPDRGKVAKEFNASDDERLSAIEDLGRAQDELTDALETAEELEKAAPEPLKEEHATIRTSIGEAKDAVTEGLAKLKMGG